MESEYLRTPLLLGLVLILSACSDAGGGSPSAPLAPSPELLEQAVEFNQQEYKVLVRDVFENPLSKEGEGVVSYVSSDEQVASVDSSGIVTVTGEGEATITAEVATGNIYKAATASFNLNAINPSIHVSGWVADDRSQLQLPAVNTALDLYVSSDPDCDIANYAACLNGDVYSLGKDTQSVTSQALSLTTTAYVKSEFGLNQIDTQLSSEGLSFSKARRIVEFKGKLWALSGVDEVSVSPEVAGEEIWNSEDGKSWVKVGVKEEFKQRYAPAVVSFNGYLWLIGGFNSGEGIYYQDVWRSADGIDWEKLSENAGFGNRDFTQSVVFAGKIWLIGGANDDGLLNDIWSSVDGINWVEEQAVGSIFSERAGHSVVVHDGAMWVIGGVIGSQIYANDVWKSTDGKNWQKVTENADWIARGFHQVLSFDKKLWLMTGGQHGLGETDENGNFTETFDDVWSSIDGKEWQLVESSNRFIRRSLASAVVFNDEMLIAGGMSYRNHTSSNALNDVWSSKDGSDWQLLSVQSLPPRAGHQVVEFNEQLWAIAGEREKINFTNDIWSSDDGVTWQQRVAEAEFEKRTNHQVIVFNEKLWLFGGDIKGRLFIETNEIWSSLDGLTWQQEVSESPFKACDNYKVLTLNNKLWLISSQRRTDNSRSLCRDEDRQMCVSDDRVNWADVKEEFTFPDLNTTDFVMYENKIWSIANLEINNIDDAIAEVWSFDGSSDWKVEQAEVDCGEVVDGCFQRAGHRLQVFKDKMWLVGRDDRISRSTDVWSSTDGKVWALETAEANYLGTSKSPMVVFKDKMLIIGGLRFERHRVGQVWSTENGIDWRLGYQHTLKFEKETTQ